MIGARQKKKIGTFIKYVFLVLGAFFILFPIFWMILTSLKERGEAIKIPPVFFPKVPKWENYPNALAGFPFLRYLGNTLLLVVINLVGTVLSSTLVAYAFSRMEWPGRSKWFWLMLSTMMIPGVCTMIPTFIMYRNYGWIDTYLPLTIPSFCGSAGNIFLLRQFYTTIPDALSESARMDGAGELRIWGTIVVPLCKPIIAMFALGTFMGTWNDFQGPLLYLNDPDKYTITYGLRAFQSKYFGGTHWGELMAAALVISLPTIIIFFCFQRYLIEGIVFSGLKG